MICLCPAASLSQRWTALRQLSYSVSTYTTDCRLKREKDVACVCPCPCVYVCMCMCLYVFVCVHAYLCMSDDNDVCTAVWSLNQHISALIIPLIELYHSALLETCNYAYKPNVCALVSSSLCVYVCMFVCMCVRVCVAPFPGWPTWSSLCSGQTHSNAHYSCFQTRTTLYTRQTGIVHDKEGGGGLLWAYSNGWGTGTAKVQ